MTQRRNKYSEHPDTHAKTLAFIAARDMGAVAYSSDGKCVPLRELDITDVEFVSGLWRIQTKFTDQITIVRDREFVLGKKLPIQERMPFEYWQAYHVGENCYGKFKSNTPDTIVAKYTTDKTIYWSYGKSIEQARAFMGIKLYDEYADLIHRHVCRRLLRCKHK